ncbi:MAG: RibD family protein [Capsulimonadales bacterium]|nr:RibD family protein [Capsulimonadales bacterium]
MMDRPYIVMQMAASIDGRITFAPGLTMFDTHPAGEMLPEGGPLWRKVEAAIDAAHHPTANLMGSGTIERENAPLRALPPVENDPASLYEDFLPMEVVNRTTNWAIVPDGRGRCRSGYRATENPGCHILHLTSHNAPPEYLAFLRREGIPYLIGGSHHVDLPEAMRKLHDKLGITAARLLGGGTLNGAMLRAGLIDEIHLIVWPMLIGGDETPTLADCPDLGPGERPARLRLISAQPQTDGQIWLHYTVDRL